MAGELGRAEIAPAVDVGAGAKRAVPLGGQQHAAQGWLMFDRIEMGVERLQHPDVEGVHLGGIVEPELDEGALRDQVHVAHGAHPIGSRVRRLSGITVALSAIRTRPSDAATMSRAGSIPGMISVATRPPSPRRMTQRSVT